MDSATTTPIYNRPYAALRTGATMPDETRIVHDQNGQKIGTIETLSDGSLVARDPAGKKVGVYDPDTDVTRVAGGRKVGVGDQLSWLLSVSAGAE
jgi:hypothetical protein